MWVFIVLLIIGSTIIVARVFRNGAEEGALESGAGDRWKRVPATSAAHATTPVSSAAAPAATSPVATPSPPEPEPASPYPPPVGEQAGGPCPSCGTETVPGAKFCGECGHRLVG